MVTDFTDEVQRLTSGIGWDADGGNGLLRTHDSELGRSYFGLLPPMESDGVVVRVKRFGGFQADGIACLGVKHQRRRASVAIHHHYWIHVALALVGPLHTSHEVVKLNRIEVLLIAHADAAHWLLP